jgi:ribosomal protein S18 acetylase RimI-like enzyme
MTHFVHVRREEFTEETVEAVVALYVRCFGMPVWQGFSKSLLEKPNLRCFFVKSNEALVGFRLGYDTGCFVWRSWLLGVVPEERRRGIGAELIFRGNGMLRTDGYQRVMAHQSPETRRLYVRLGQTSRLKASGDRIYELS